MNLETIIKLTVFSGIVASTCVGEEQQTEAAKRPNILFALADDWSYGHAGVFDCQWVKTPSVDRVADQGLLFTNAYTPVAKCAPSRAAILTGRDPWLLKAGANHFGFFPLEFATYADTLAKNGYWVGMTGKGWAPGFAKDANGKRRPMAGKPFQEHTLTPPTTQISDNDYTANFEEFLNASPDGEPWCFWFGSEEPHRRYEYGTGVSKGGMDIAKIDRVPGYWPDNEVVRNDMADYAFELQHFDKHLGKMLDLLEKRGELENTIVVVASDNGMPFPHVKGYAYYDSNHLPLMVMWKAGLKQAGRKTDAYVSYSDLAPTFMELAGVDWSKTEMAPASGRSFADLIANDPKHQRDHVLIGKERNDVGRPGDLGYPIRGIVKDGMLYIHNFEPDRWPGGNPETGYAETDGSPTKTEVLKTRRNPEQSHFWDACFGKLPADQLFELNKDPDCLNNLAEKVDFSSLKKQLFDELTAQGDPRMLGNAAIFDEAPNASPKLRNFYERYMNGEDLDPKWLNPSDFENIEDSEMDEPSSVEE